jgi:tetratricopeptide (TPR) repeat protein
VLAAVHTCRREWQPAKDEFTRALRLEPDETRYHPWYAAFLMATGKESEALELVARRAEERPGDPFAHAIWGLFAYVAREFDTAEALLSEAVSKNPRNWVACFAYACLRLQQEKTDGQAARLVLKAHETLSMDVFPGLRFLCLRAVSPPDEETLDFEIGLIAKSDSENDYWSPLQHALGQIAYGEHDEALASLSEAFNERSPFMAWLHLWPLLDPLRGDKRFTRLLTRMKLPHVN